MAVKIRLRRMGAKKMPRYRMVVSDSRMTPTGRFIEDLGYYDPTKDPEVLEVDEERALDWLKKGAQPSGTAKALLRKLGVLEQYAEERSG